jgi:hypothetical protein
LKTRRNASIMLAALVTALTACASGADPDPLADPPAATDLAISPEALEIAPGDTAQFTVAAATLAAADVTWSVQGGGTVSTTGLFTAPESEGTYHVVATSTFDSAQEAHAIVTVKLEPAPPPPPPPANTQGTGTSYKPSYLTAVTGGGAMPSWTTNVVTAACAGDGTTDDTACLQAAADSARSQNRPLVIPKTSSFYRITGPIKIYGSVGGVGGMPTIKQTNTSATWGAQKMMILQPGMTGWIYNLHLVGTFNGSNNVTEHGHQLDVGSVNGVTIKGNLIENAMGDNISSDISQYDGPGGQNVIVDGNTLRNPYRCAVGFISNQRNWVIMNNVIEKPVNFVSGIDVEPEGGGTVVGLEIAYNRFVMNNRTVNPSRGADGKAVFGWRVEATPNPGGDFWIHHNYGTFGTGFSGFINGGWGPIYQASNVEGQSVPN